MRSERASVLQEADAAAWSPSCHRRAARAAPPRPRGGRCPKWRRFRRRRRTSARRCAPCRRSRRRRRSPSARPARRSVGRLDDDAPKFAGRSNGRRHGIKRARSARRSRVVKKQVVTRFPRVRRRARLAPIVACRRGGCGVAPLPIAVVVGSPRRPMRTTGTLRSAVGRVMTAGVRPRRTRRRRRPATARFVRAGGDRRIASRARESRPLEADDDAQPPSSRRPIPRRDVVDTLLTPCSAVAASVFNGALRTRASRPSRGRGPQRLAATSLGRATECRDCPRHVDDLEHQCFADADGRVPEREEASEPRARVAARRRNIRLHHTYAGARSIRLAGCHYWRGYLMLCDLVPYWPRAPNADSRRRGPGFAGLGSSLVRSERRRDGRRPAHPGATAPSRRARGVSAFGLRATAAAVSTRLDRTKRASLRNSRP